MVSHEQVITKSVGNYLSSYARGAVEPFRNKGLDEDKLKAEVSQPSQDTCDRYAPLEDGSDNPGANRSNRPLQENTKMKFDGMEAYPTGWLELSLIARER
jgi:hypothetical protein